jgi:transposase InsO family protein
MQRLKAAWQAQHPPKPWSLRRGLGAQHASRAVEHGVRKSALVFRRWTAAQGLPRWRTADLLRLSPRTLGDWELAWLRDRLQPRPRGRPQRRATRVLRNDIIAVLRNLSPAVGLPTLQGFFPEVARQELADLLRRFRRVYLRDHQLLAHVLHWHRPGAVWAVDFSDAPAPIEGQFPYLLAVRDVTTGSQLAWLPCVHPDATTAADALTALFQEHGAPFVLKADNGSPFRSEEVLGLLDAKNVTPLFSPVRMPRYNGACEAGNGSLKTRTHYQAARHGRPGDWTTDDCEAARLQANETARPWGAKGPTPDELWRDCQPLSQLDRLRFQRQVLHEERKARSEQAYDPDAALSFQAQAALDRTAVRRALGALGLLKYSRRRFTLPIKRLKVANIR